MARDYPEHDWRGIAMLTQQLGQLFEPSKTRLMSQQQEHEMNMLMAKQAWKTESEQLDLYKTKFQDMSKQIDTFTQNMVGRGLDDLVNASSKDGAMPEQAIEVNEKTNGYRLSEMQKLAEKWQTMVQEKEKILDTFQLYDSTARFGEQWRKGSMNKKDQTGVMVDYYKDANIDGLPDLSYEEGQNAIKSYIKDNYSPRDDKEDAVEITFGSGDQTESFLVRPEAIAFRAGFEANIGTGTGRGKAEKGEISQKQAIVNAQNELLGGKTHLKMSDEELIKSTLYNKKIFEDIDSSNPKVKLPLGLFMEMGSTGDFIAKEKAYKLGFKRDAVDFYTGAYTNYTKGLKELLRREISLPGKVTQTSGILTQMQVPNDKAIQIIQDFNTYNSNPDTLLTQINTYEPSDSTSAPKEQLHQAYMDFLKQLTTMDSQKRREGIQRFTNLMSK